ncbi:MAG TPA: hypothetical protein VGN16_15250 [Acidobacteriaceae bacterium]|jgi:predicted transcriptional regulator
MQREVLDVCLEDHAQLEAALKEGDRQIDAGETVAHDDIGA